MIYYYKKRYIAHLIRKCVIDREISAIGDKGVIRALRFKCLFDFERILKIINWENNRQNLYRSVAKIKNIPSFTFNPKERSNETSKWYHNEFNKEIYEYDLFLDFDKDENSTVYDVLIEVKELLEYLNEYKIPYYVLFSGNKGFQVIVDGKYIENIIFIDGFVYPHKKIAEDILKSFKFKYLDLRNNGVPNRLCKIPYSLVGENIALPLSDEQIEDFSLDDMKMNNVIYKVKPLDYRGTLERFEGISKEEKIKNIKNFLDSIDFK